MKQYIDSLKSEMEETSEKYDRITIKYRDMTIEIENIKSIYDVTMA